MRDKKKKTIKVRDLKPSKDAKGGVSVDVHGVQNRGVQNRGVQNRGVQGSHSTNLHI